HIADPTISNTSVWCCRFILVWLDVSIIEMVLVSLGQMHWLISATTVVLITTFSLLVVLVYSIGQHGGLPRLFNNPGRIVRKPNTRCQDLLGGLLFTMIIGPRIRLDLTRHDHERTDRWLAKCLDHVSIAVVEDDQRHGATIG